LIKRFLYARHLTQAELRIPYADIREHCYGFMMNAWLGANRAFGQKTPVIKTTDCHVQKMGYYLSHLQNYRRQAK